MFRWSLVVTMLFALPAALRADAFDYYTNSVLAKVPEAKDVKELKQLTTEQIVEHSNVLPGVQAALVVVQTNDGCFTKLLVQSARKRLNDEDKTLVPILLIDRYVTYRAGTERTVSASGNNVILFDGFRISLDMGQIVPEKVGGDLRFVVKEDGATYVEPIGKAKLFLLTKPLPEATPKKGAKFVIGETFETRFFNGRFKLHDDGRRSGVLELKVKEDGEVVGTYFSDRDGAKYDVYGKIGQQKHSILFAIKFPRTEQVFQGWLFTGTGLILSGSSKLQDREAGFYATRIEEE
ncbi:MAG: hypothetical protein K2R98_02095 [Gemmataceae bacterium]|nr:hypothetical protein [Gemmataceae bacterium]